MFVAKRAGPDIHQIFAVFSYWVKEPNDTDWKILLRMIKYLNGTKGKYLTLISDDLKVIKWYLEEIFVVHPDFKSYIISIMTMGQGLMQSVSRK